MLNGHEMMVTLDEQSPTDPALRITHLEKNEFYEDA